MSQPENSNQLPDMGLKRIGRLIVGQNTAVVVGTQFTLTFRVPAGYKRVTGILFDPSQDVRLTINSQNLASDILSNVSTAQGTAMGFINPNHIYAEQDILTLSGIPAVLTKATLNFALQYE